MKNKYLYSAKLGWKGGRKYIASMSASLNTEIMTVCKRSLGFFYIFIVVFTSS